MKTQPVRKHLTRREFLLSTSTALVSLFVPHGELSHAPNDPQISRTQPSSLGAKGPLIVDHRVVDQWQTIPQTYIDLVKCMWLNIPGESHSAAYRSGCELLQGVDSRFQVNVIESGDPEDPTDQHLRVSHAVRSDYASWQYGYGEANWYTNAPAIQHTKDHLGYCNTNNLEIAAFGFGWCWDMTWQNDPGGGIDPIHQVRWAGSSEGGPDGNLRWGLDAADFPLTGNHVCMDTYLDATQGYIDFCQANGYPTKVFFTTGPVDSNGNTGENGYQRHLKHEHIRNYIKASSDLILFDYADILCWGEDGQEQIANWTDHGGTLQTFQVIHPDSLKDLVGNDDSSVGHIGANGALRLAKALWWMLARLAGWEGTAVELPNKVYIPLVKK